jgi:hypothetical protein
LGDTIAYDQESPRVLIRISRDIHRAIWGIETRETARAVCDVHRAIWGVVPAESCPRRVGDIQRTIRGEGSDIARIVWYQSDPEVSVCVDHQRLASDFLEIRILPLGSWRSPTSSSSQDSSCTLL